ncbi:hypothetical protein CICLE_v10024158mg, partial [Citrus x clementina]
CLAEGERSSWTKDGDNRIQTDVIYNKFTGHVFQLHLQNPNSIPKFLDSVSSFGYLNLSQAGFMGLIPSST